MSVLTSALGSAACSDDQDMVKQPSSANETPPQTHVPRASRGSSGGAPARPADTSSSRIRRADVELARAKLTARDWEILEAVNTLRAVTGAQLDRLCFAEVREGRSRIATRSRALGRLVRWRVLATVGRRVGGSDKGSSAQAYAVDRVGQRLLQERQLSAGQRVRVRRPIPPGRYALAHVLAVAELYADLTEQAGGTVATFKAEPAAHWPNGLGGWLKPDALVVLERPGVRDLWWIEVDMATESLPVIRAKVQTYLDFQRRGERGPEDVMPWVLISTISGRRRDAIRAVVRKLHAEELVRVRTHAEAAPEMLAVLRE